MTEYQFQVSNHPRAGEQPATEAAAASWQTLYTGTVATPAEARVAADQLAEWFRHVRVFRGKEIGRLWYAVSDGRQR